MRLLPVILGLLAVSCLTPVDDRPDGGTGGGTGGGGTATGGGSSTGGGSGGGSPTGGGSGGGVTGGGGGSTTCSPACGIGRECCGGMCVNTSNDPFSCGNCDTVCTGATPYCGGGVCSAPPCSIDAGVCGSGESCCGGACCGAGQLCCDVQGPVSGFQSCHTPTAMEPTCPRGCSPLCQSDRNIKTEITPIDERGVLEQVATLPISSWQYSNDPSATRHLGPMAQDFRATFNLGDTDRAYNPIDAHGVSLASIKALYRLVQDQQLRLDRLEAENARLRAENAVCR